MTDIGIIGVGLMGHGIAINIARAGWPLCFLDHPGNQDTTDLVELGASPMASIASLCERAGIIITCVTGSSEVEAVVLGEGGVAQHIRAGSTLIDCSTAIPESTQRVAAAIHAAHAGFLDAPMTRTPREAAEGRLNLIIGGDGDLLESCRPLLQCFSEHITHAGPVGAGHTVKLLHNFVSLGYSAVLAEASACAARAGIEADTLVDVLANGGGGGVVLDRLAPAISSGDNSGFRFSLANASKDMGYYLQMAWDLNAEHVAAAAIGSLYAAAEQDCAVNAPVPALIEYLRANKP